jgi:hypothetical protein
MDIIPYLPFRRCLNDAWALALLQQIFYQTPIAKLSPVEMCGFVHVGIPLNLDSNIAYNDINNLISLIFDGGSNIIKNLINKAYSEEDIKKNGLLELIYSKKWRETLLLGSIKCIPFVPDLKPINKFELGNFILDNVSELIEFNEKCNVLKPLDLADFMKTAGEEVCGETEYQQNVNLTILATVSAQAASNMAEYHRLNKYEELLDKLIFKEAETKKSILNKTDEEGNIYLKQSDYEEQKKIKELIINNRFKLPNIEAIYLGPFNNYDFVEF